MFPERLLRPGRLHLVDMGEGIFNAAELADESRGRLLPDGGNAGDIVGRISLDGLDIDELRGRYPVFLPDSVSS